MSLLREKSIYPCFSNFWNQLALSDGKLEVRVSSEAGPFAYAHC